MDFTLSPEHDAVRKAVKDGDVEFLFAQFVDMHGKPSAKLVPAHHLDDLLSDGAGFAGFAAGDIGQGPHDPDIAAIPDPRSFTILPWQPNVARLACDVTVEGQPWPFCPRTILRNAVDRAATLGYRMKIGLEAEFFLVRKDEHGKLIVDEIRANGPMTFRRFMELALYHASEPSSDSGGRFCSTRSRGVCVGDGSPIGPCGCGCSHGRRGPRPRAGSRGRRREDGCAPGCRCVSRATYAPAPDR